MIPAWFAIPTCDQLFRIADYSEVHGDLGTVYSVQPDFIVVAIDEGGYLWPVAPRDLEPFESLGQKTFSDDNPIGAARRAIRTGALVRHSRSRPAKQRG